MTFFATERWSESCTPLTDGGGSARRVCHGGFEPVTSDLPWLHEGGDQAMYLRAASSRLIRSQSHPIFRPTLFYPRHFDFKPDSFRSPHNSHHWVLQPPRNKTSRLLGTASLGKRLLVGPSRQSS